MAVAAREGTPPTPAPAPAAATLPGGSIAVAAGLRVGVGFKESAWEPPEGFGVVVGLGVGIGCQESPKELSPPLELGRMVSTEVAASRMTLPRLPSFPEASEAMAVAVGAAAGATREKAPQELPIRPGRIV